MPSRPIERGAPMTEVPFHLRYTLTRTQRLVPHLRIWGPIWSACMVILLAFVLYSVIASAVLRDAKGVFAFTAAALGLFVLFRGLFVGLLDVLLVPARKVDVIIEENTADILIGGERWCLFLDGITRIGKYRRDVWTIQHHNGSVLHVPTSAIAEAQIAHLTAAMERGRTPEGIQAVIERGKRIEAIMSAERR